MLGFLRQSSSRMRLQTLNSAVAAVPSLCRLDIFPLAAGSSRRYPTTAKRPRKPLRLLRGRYQSFPHTIYRVGPTRSVVLRDQAVQYAAQKAAYDVVLHDGMVLPAEGEEFIGPNGASMRPNTFTLQEVVRTFNGPEVTVYCIEKGTHLPSDLVLLHEYRDHFSLQCTRPMELEELNQRMTSFVQENATGMSQFEFMQKYPLESAEDPNQIK